MNTVAVEVCCGSIDDVITAGLCGADRAEFCQGLPLGGLTPSFGTFLTAKELTKIPMMVMIRPRGGGFCYSNQEFSAMVRDVQLFVNNGAEGIVCGCLTQYGKIDVERCRILKEASGNAQLVFHRAFDVCSDLWSALEALIDIGFTRILTSGREPTALEGAAFLRELIVGSSDKIEILGGSGINSRNVLQVISAAGLSQIHLSASVRLRDTSGDKNKKINFGVGISHDNTFAVTDADELGKVIRSLRGV